MEQLYFLETAIPKKENWLQNMTEEEKAVMAQHFAYVNQLFSEGKIFFSGACTDGAMGIIIYQAESYESAFEMFQNDPLVKSGITNTDLHPFKAGHMQ
ncbi:YciI family protein [Neobacillus massiliamazoniensis]|uniref:YciI-like protein n=1 Tax=Neobacillus massiliamazoniensis TaxID=1499688 RepID=A0A0U1NVX1_9BACI|nr:YciI family protein [Neobacillus massiliamazoniensis]CRK81978.1 YciI-like protein [Neobacillus massiliamazoniensis]